jgi:photosynthetic reaction center cytochrome c subunit
MLRSLRSRIFAGARVWAALGLAAAGGAARAQVPEKPSNLQYYPKDTSTKKLMGTMRGFSFSLGVRCQHCHVDHGSNPNSLDQVDFASDEKETKRTARTMLRMVDAINQEYIAKLGRSAPVKVECVTCHHRLTIPETMNAFLAETIEEKGIAPALALYRELRAKSLGEGQYDFGETPLNILTESLLAQRKGAEAAAIMELNVEFNTPPTGWAMSLLAMSHQTNKETEKAKADFAKILEKNPQDKWARQQLDQLNAPKP